MGKTTLVNTSTDIMTAYQALHYLNNKGGTNYQSLALAIVGVGIAVATTLISAGLAPILVATLNSVGLAIGATSMVQMIAESLDKYEPGLRAAISKLHVHGFIRITTKTYTWESASGNSYTWYSEHSFQTINP